jgi:hypothetical protein
MCAERIMLHELLGNFAGKRRLEPALHINTGELATFRFDIGRKLTTLELQVGALGIGLRAHRNVLSRGHRHRARDEPSESGCEHRAARRARGCNAYDQTGGGNDSIVCTEHGGAEPTAALGAMYLPVTSSHCVVLTIAYDGDYR